MDCISHHRPWARRRLGTHEQGALRAEYYTQIPTIAITLSCCGAAGWDGVVVEARCGWGRLGSGLVAHTSCASWSAWHLSHGVAAAPFLH